MASKKVSVLDMNLDQVRAHIQELVARIAAHDALPVNHNPPGCLHKLTPSAKKRSDKLSWEVYHATSRKRELEGNPINTAGYTGRKSNRR